MQKDVHIVCFKGQNTALVFTQRRMKFLYCAVCILWMWVEAWDALLLK